LQVTWSIYHPSSGLDDTTPHEVWIWIRNPLFNISGCLVVDAYVDVPKENTSELDKKVEMCIFIGYKGGAKRL
jgi:hypothetical protein